MANGADPFDFSEFGSPSGSGTAPFQGSEPTPSVSPPPLGFGPSPPSGGQPFAGQQPPGPFGQVPQFGQAGDPFNNAALAVSPTAVAQVRPPVRWLVVGAAVAVVGMLLALIVGGRIPLAVAGWVLAGPVAIGLLAAFTIADTRQRARPLYSFPSWLPWAYRGVLLLAMLGVAAGAWRIAEWAGRL